VSRYTPRMTRSHGPLRFPVGDLLTDPGRRRLVDITADVEWSLASSRIAAPIVGTLSLQGTTGGVFVTGSVATEAMHTCNRCLREFSDEVAAEIQDLVGGEDPEYPLDHDVADLEPVVRDAVLLLLPLLPLCDPECRGLCATCGADLNTGAGPGHEEASDSPFTALRGLLEP
jgi:uncharacterized protein